MIRVHSVEQKTKAGIEAFQKALAISKRTKSMDYSGYYPKASTELLSKREYMQSDEFLHDPHNVEMFRITDWLMQARDSVTKNVEKSYGGLKQAINGFTVVARELRQNPNLNFAKRPTYNTSADMSLYNAKIRMHTFVNSIK